MSTRSPAPALRSSRCCSAPPTRRSDETPHRQMMAWRTLADTHSLTTTVPMMTSRISDTWVQASVVIAALRGRPMPPAPTRPSTVDSRMLMSQRNTEMPANAGITCGTMPYAPTWARPGPRQRLRHAAIGGDLGWAGAGRAHRLDLACVNPLEGLVEQLGAETDRAQSD